MKYFAYGMNTNLAQMALRCPEANSLGKAVLYQYEFRFAHHADVVENSSSNVQGVLWDITDQCLAALDALEGYPTYYERKIVTVFHNGNPTPAITYYMVPGIADEYPSDGYLAMLKDGYTDHDVRHEQLDRALEFVEQYYTALAQKGQPYHG